MTTLKKQITPRSVEIYDKEMKANGSNYNFRFSLSKLLENSTPTDHDESVGLAKPNFNETPSSSQANANGVFPQFTQNKLQKANNFVTNDYLTLENTRRYNLEAYIESKRMTDEARNSNVEDKTHGDNFSENVFSDPNNMDQDMTNLLMPYRRQRRFSISSIPVSRVSAFSAFGKKPHAFKQPKRSLVQILLHNSVMFGREFCYAIEGGLTTPILLSIGLPLNMYSLVWVLSPMLGFVLQPIIGNLSDR